MDGDGVTGGARPGTGTAADGGSLLLAEEDPAVTDEPRPRRRLVRRLLISLGVLAVVLALAIGGGVWYLTSKYAGNINHVSGVFDGLDEAQRPAPATPAQKESAPPVTFLLMGSDTRAHPTSGTAPDGRSDAIIIARLTGDRERAQFVSIPRDSWVDIPGHGMNKINASYAFGGPDLLVKTVEQLTHVRIDHFVAIDFDGINAVTDALGGVDVKVAQTTKNGPYTFPAGTVHLTGDMARWYVGQRHGLPGSDFDRERRQQQYIKAVLTKLLKSHTFDDDGTLDTVLKALTGSVTVDSGLSDTELLTIGRSAHRLSGSDIDFLTAPVLGTGREGAADVVYLDPAADQRMWTYLNTDSLGQNAGEFPRQKLPEIPN